MTEAEMGAMGMGTWVIIAAFLLFTVYLWYRIFSKAGFNGFLALLMLIPLVNFIVLLYFAFAEWPVQKELREAKTTLPPG